VGGKYGGQSLRKRGEKKKVEGQESKKVDWGTMLVNAGSGGR
jgi:hypothetical protein